MSLLIGLGRGKGGSGGNANPLRITSKAGFVFDLSSEDVIHQITANKEGAKFHLGYPAPAPEGITLTPDAVGDNPVTWYYKVFFSYYEAALGIDTFRSIFDEEKTLIIGDDTTVINGTGWGDITLPFWASALNVQLGLSSGEYTKADNINLTNGNLNYFNEGEFTVNSPVGGYEDVPLKYYSIPYGTPAPPPTNITITPDAVGTNPVTWYYKVIQLTTAYKRTESSEEQSYHVGDSTTELIFDCTHVDYGDTDLFVIIKGTETGVYTNMMFMSFTPPDDFTPIADVLLPYDLLTGADVPAGVELVNDSIVLTAPLYLPLYDNESFSVDEDTGELSILADPLLEDVNNDYMYEIFVVASLNGENAEGKAYGFGIGG